MGYTGISEQSIRETQVLTGSCSEWARWGVLASMLLCNPAAVFRWDSWNQIARETDNAWGKCLRICCSWRTVSIKVFFSESTAWPNCLWLVPYKSSSENVAKFIFKMLLLSAGPVLGLEHSLEVWEVWVKLLLSACGYKSASSNRPKSCPCCQAGMRSSIIFACSSELTPFYSRDHEFWRWAEEQMRGRVFYCSPVAETHRQQRVAGCSSCIFKVCTFYSKQTMDNNL